jgi:hypothetical protein
MKKLGLQLLGAGLMFTALCSAARASTPITFGQTLTGTIGSAAQVNSYSFSANAGDIVDVTVTATSGSLSPEIQLLISNGTQVPGSPVKTSGNTVELNPATLPASPSGVYTIEVSDSYATYTGNYAIYLQRQDDPGGTVPLPFGQTQTGTISQAAQSNTYTFLANAGDVVFLTMTTTTDDFDPEIKLFLSDGTPVGSPAIAAGCNANTVEMNPVTLPASPNGTYTVEVSDCASYWTGNYALYAQRLNNPGGMVFPLLLGEAQTASIGLAAQSNTYTFTANAGDIVDLTMTSTSDDFDPEIKLFLSDGTPVGSPAIAAGCNANTVEMNPVKLPASPNGTYLVEVSDCASYWTGNYGIYAQRLSNPGNSNGLLWQQPQIGTIAMAAQSDTYTFKGTAGDSIDLTVTASSGYLSPKIRIFYENGSPFVSANLPSGSCNATSTSLSELSIPTTENYTVLIGDCNDTYTGNYGVSSECFGTCLLATPTLTSISSTSALAGSGGFTLTVNGSNFVNQDANSVVQWNGNDLATTWVSTIQMTAAVPAGDVATAGIFPVTVFTPGGGTSNPIDFTVNNPVPTLTSISSTSALVGATFTLTVTGTNFVQGSAVQWNSNSLATTYVSSTELKAVVPVTDTATAGVFPVSVFNFTPGGGTSSSIDFTVNNPVPTVTSISPTIAVKGGATFTLTVKGTNFVQGSAVQWNSNSLATTYVSSTELTAQVPATDIETDGTASVTVFNSSPGGGTGGPETFTVVTPTPATLSSPTPSSVLTGPTITFSWTAETGATNYSLRLGTTMGSNNLYGSGYLSTTSATVTNLPTNGETIYAQLTTYYGTAIQVYNDYTFTATTQAALTSPANDSVLVGPKVTFTWTAATGATNYSLKLGTTVGSNNLYGSGYVTGTSATPTDLPANGETIYATLTTYYGTAQASTSYTYTAATQSALSSPANNSVLAGPKVTFTWTTAPGSTNYALKLGTTAGSNNLYGSGYLSTTSATPTTLPTNGEPIYATLTTFYGTIAENTNYTFTAATQAALTSPANNSVLVGPKVTFTWTAAPGSTNYSLKLGTTVGSNNIYGSGYLSTTSATPIDLPANGEPVYATLTTYYGSIAESTNYTFTAATQAALTSPANDSVLTGPNPTFEWTTAAGATNYSLALGTTVGSNNLYGSGYLSTTSATPTNLPTNGETIYAKLTTYYGTVSAYTNYTFTATTQAALTSPANASVLVGPKVTFTWTAATGATDYSLKLGTTVGSNNLYGSGYLTATSATPTNLPANGETIYATLTTYYGSIAVSTNYAFVAATQAALTSPANNAVFTSSSQTFEWTTAPAATNYSLKLGTTAGSNNLYGSGYLSGTSATATGLPTNGETIYGTLTTYYGSVAATTSYTFTAYTSAGPSGVAKGR